MAWVALALGLTLSVLGWRAAGHKTQELADSRFQARAQELHQALQFRVDAYSEALRGAQAYAGATGRPDRAEFARLNATLRFGDTLPGISVFAYLAAVPKESRQAFERSLKREYPDFEIRPTGERDEYVVVTTVAPEIPHNLRAIGSDSLSNPLRHEAITAARDSGETRITAKLNLVMDASNAPPAFLMYQAVYRNGELPVTVNDRRAKIAGYIVGAFRVDTLLAAAVGERQRDIALRVHDGLDRRDDNLYFSSHPGTAFVGARHSLSATVEVGGRSWLVDYAALPAFNAEAESLDPSLRLLAGGIIASLLLASIVWQLASTRARALRLARDMTRSLRTSESKLRALFEQAPVGAWLTDLKGVVVDCNDKFAAYVGATRENVIGFNVFEQSRDQTLVAPLRRAIAGESVAFEAPYTSTTGNRSSVYSWHFQPVLIDEQPSYVLCFVEDISDRKLAEAHIEHLAHHDALTGLANRSLLKDRLHQAMAQAGRADSQLALLFIDLDFFKHINDTVGHSAGDAMLIEIAGRLHGCVRQSDTLARIGGDEFVILLTNVGNDIDCSRVAQNVIETIAEPITIDGQVFTTSASIGIAVWPQDGSDSEALTRNADVAMYHAKANGRNNFQFFRPEMNARAQELAVMEQALRMALDRGEFLLHYQPQYDCTTGAVVGAEALLRWHHPELGLLLPGRFIQIAEERGLIEPIGDWVIGAACHQARVWRDAGLPPVRIAVNISPIQLRKGRLTRIIEQALRDNQLAPEALALEITEGAVMEDVNLATHQLGVLSEAGMMIEIDDFGTGHSSLAYLKQLPIHRLKIDQSFVRGVPDDAEDAAIVGAIVSLAGSLYLDTIAEGVETVEQRDFLTARGCTQMQGYLFARPLPPDDFAALLKK